MKKKYPSKVAIKSVIESVKACGMNIGVVQLNMDGEIRITAEVPRNDNKDEAEFDRWLEDGKLG